MKKQSNNKANVFTIDINQMIKQNIEESQKNNKPKRTPTPCIQRNKIIYPKKGFYSKRFHTEENGIVIDTSRMNKILELDQENLTLTLEPGVLLMDIGIKYLPGL